MDPQDLADRVARLERENRRLKRIGAVVLLGIVAVVVMGQTTRPEVHDVLAAKKFVLKDRDGKDRGTLFMQGETAEFGLFDGDERDAVGLSAHRDGRAWLGLGDQMGRGSRISLGCHGEGASLALFEKARAPYGHCARVDVSPRGARFGLEKVEDWSLPRLGVKPLVEIEISDVLPNRIVVRDKKGEVIFEKGEEPSSTPK